jgi:hypothetical protein
MQRFPCNGRLNISWKGGSKTIKISITHKVWHAPYDDISIPPKWRAFILANKDSKPPKVRVFIAQVLFLTNSFQIWKSIMEKNQEENGPQAILSFNQRSIHYYWTQLVRDDLEEVGHKETSQSERAKQQQLGIPKASLHVPRDGSRDECVLE